MFKNSKNRPLFLVSLFMILAILFLIVVNYFYTNIKWASYDLPGLNFTKQEEGVKYRGEKYICDDNKFLFVEIKGSWNNIRNRTAQMTMFDKFSGGASGLNMKLKDVNKNEVIYVYKENSLVINKDGLAKFLINDIPVLKNCSH